MKSHDITSMGKEGSLSEAGEFPGCRMIDNAVEHYRELLRHCPWKFYLWSQAAEFVDDRDIRIGMLGKALLLGRDDNFLVGARLAMASELIAAGNAAAAKHELHRYAMTYRSNGWRPRGEYYKLLESAGEVEATSGNDGLYAEYGRLAESFVYDGLPAQVAVKVAERHIDDRNRPGRRIETWCFRTREGKIWVRNPARYGIKEHLCNGAVASIRVKDGKVVKISPEEDFPEGEDWLKKVSGEVSLRTDRNGCLYTKIADVYVGKQHLDGVREGERLCVVAVRQEDSRWMAIAAES